jgi:hypothetical protein
VRFSPLIATICLIAVASPVAAQTPVGVYSSVRVHPETGDVLGDEIEFRPGPKLMAVVTICERARWGGKAWPVTVTGSRIAIPVLMQGLVDQDGRPAKDQPVPLVGSFTGGILRIETQREPLSETLKRLRSPRANQTAMLACGKPNC